MKAHLKNFTLIELLTVFSCLWGLGLMFGNLVIDPQIKANELACINNLKQLGMQVSQAKGSSAIKTAGYTNANPTSLAPLRDMVAAGLISEKSLLTCPVGYSGYSVANLDEKTIGLNSQKDLAPDKLHIREGNKVASHYLFTLFYDNKSRGNRVIAADAADPKGSGVNGFSPNHSDTAQKKRRGANALFMDGHVKSAVSYKVSGASDKSNLWSNDVKSLTAKDITKTRIGHY